jgi:hypothetical protein
MLDGTIEVWVLIYLHVTHGGYGEVEFVTPEVVGVFPDVESANAAIVARQIVAQNGDTVEGPSVRISIVSGEYLLSKQVLQGPFHVAFRQPESDTVHCPNCGAPGLHVWQYTCPHCLRQTGFPQDDAYDDPPF